MADLFSKQKKMYFLNKKKYKSSNRTSSREEC